MFTFPPCCPYPHVPLLVCVCPASSYRNFCRMTETEIRLDSGVKCSPLTVSCLPPQERQFLPFLRLLLRVHLPVWRARATVHRHRRLGDMVSLLAVHALASCIQFMYPDSVTRLAVLNVPITGLMMILDGSTHTRTHTHTHTRVVYVLCLVRVCLCVSPVVG